MIGPTSKALCLACGYETVIATLYPAKAPHGPDGCTERLHIEGCLCARCRTAKWNAERSRG